METTDELGHELAEEAKEWGGSVYPVECLSQRAVVQGFCQVRGQAEGSAQDKEDIEYQLKAEDYDQMPELYESVVSREDPAFANNSFPLPFWLVELGLLLLR